MTRPVASSLRYFATLLVTVFVAACDNSQPEPLSAVEIAPTASVPAQTNTNSPNPTLTVAFNDEVDPGDTLTLVFSDEFDGTTIDTSKWFFETGDGTEAGIPGWGNNELQYYLPDSAQVEGGVLKITAREQRIVARVGQQTNIFDYTSARINTRDRFAFRYGRIEASIKLPGGKGIWPAFWLLSQDSPYGSWAASGEIDIVEAVNLGGIGGNRVFGRQPVHIEYLRRAGQPDERDRRVSRVRGGVGRDRDSVVRRRRVVRGGEQLVLDEGTVPGAVRSPVLHHPQRGGRRQSARPAQFRHRVPGDHGGRLGARLLGRTLGACRGGAAVHGARRIDAPRSRRMGGRRAYDATAINITTTAGACLPGIDPRDY